MMTAKEVAEATRAAVSGPDFEGPFSAILTDSRAVEPGCLFVCLRGERFDGHEFAAQAAEQGAKGLVVADDWEGSVPGVAIFRVPDTLRALGDLARAWRRQMPAKVVAVT